MRGNQDHPDHERTHAYWWSWYSHAHDPSRPCIGNQAPYLSQAGTFKRVHFVQGRRDTLTHQSNMRGNHIIQTMSAPMLPVGPVTPTPMIPVGPALATRPHSCRQAGTCQACALCSKMTRHSTHQDNMRGNEHRPDHGRTPSPCWSCHSHDPSRPCIGIGNQAPTLLQAGTCKRVQFVQGKCGTRHIRATCAATNVIRTMSAPVLPAGPVGPASATRPQFTGQLKRMQLCKT